MFLPAASILYATQISIAGNDLSPDVYRLPRIVSLKLPSFELISTGLFFANVIDHGG